MVYNSRKFSNMTGWHYAQTNHWRPETQLRKGMEGVAAKEEVDAEGHGNGRWRLYPHCQEH